MVLKCDNYGKFMLITNIQIVFWIVKPVEPNCPPSSVVWTSHRINSVVEHRLQPFIFSFKLIVSLLNSINCQMPFQLKAYSYFFLSLNILSIIQIEIILHCFMAVSDLTGEKDSVYCRNIGQAWWSFSLLGIMLVEKRQLRINGFLEKQLWLTTGCLLFYRGIPPLA